MRWYWWIVIFYLVIFEVLFALFLMQEWEAGKRKKLSKYTAEQLIEELESV